MSQKRDSQFVNVVLQDNSGHILLSCGRKAASSERDDDSIYFVAPRTDDDSTEISLQLQEAEDFLEMVLPLVSDAKERPFGGSLYVSTVVGDSGARLSFSIKDTDDYVAHVALLERRRGEETVTQFDVNRESLDRFLYAALEGICDDMVDDD